MFGEAGTLHRFHVLTVLLAIINPAFVYVGFFSVMYYVFKYFIGGTIQDG